MPRQLQPSPFTAPAESVPASNPSGRFRALKQFGLVLLCAAWVVLGLVGHDPWKTEDATAFGVTWDMMQRGNLLTPTLVGEPYVERPPLVYVLAAFSGYLFTPWLEPHDAARLAVGALLAATLVLLSLTARELAGRTMRWMPVLIFIGSIGLWDRAHQLSPELGLLAGLALAQYGWALAVRRPAIGGLVIGLGTSLAFLSYGFLGPVWIALAVILLPVLFAPWRTRRYLVTVLAAAGVSIAGTAAWPLALASIAPDHVQAWWEGQSVAAYFAPLATDGWGDPLYLAKNLPWFTWPASPLVVWTLWTRGRGFNGGMRSPAVQVPGALALAILIALVLMPEPRAIHIMMLILPLSLLGALEVDTLKRGFSGALDWFGILTFGLLAALAWWAWWDAYAHGMSLAIARAFRDTAIGYQPSFHGREMIVCVLLTVLWLSLVRPARRSNRRAILNWAAGTTLLWALYMTIWLPYLDSRRSYRIVAEAAALHLPANECVASRNLGEPQRALFYYFAGIVTEREESHPDMPCPALLVQYGRDDPDPAVLEGWTQAWEGRRRGDATERYVIYTRAPARAGLPAGKPS
ncbi:MAG: hypothetical protein ABJC33_05520 [Betaproteobacteria bacterium]